MKENVRLLDEVENSLHILSKITKVEENLDKPLGNRRLSNDKTGLGSEENSNENIEEEKSYYEKP